MNRYILRRIVQMLPVLFGITIITFTFTELAPGDAVSAMILMDFETGASGDDGSNAEKLREKYGLDKSPPVRYLQWMGGLLQGNLGVRIRSKIPVADEVARRLPATLRLMAAAMAISILLGIPLGIFSALNQYTTPDYVLTFLTFHRHLHSRLFCRHWRHLCVLIEIGMAADQWLFHHRQRFWPLGHDAGSPALSGPAGGRVGAGDNCRDYALHPFQRARGRAARLYHRRPQQRVERKSSDLCAIPCATPSCR